MLNLFPLHFFVYLVSDSSARELIVCMCGGTYCLGSSPEPRTCASSSASGGYQRCRSTTVLPAGEITMLKLSIPPPPRMAWPLGLHNCLRFPGRIATPCTHFRIPAGYAAEINRPAFLSQSSTFAPGGRYIAQYSSKGENDLGRIRLYVQLYLKFLLPRVPPSSIAVLPVCPMLPPLVPFCLLQLSDYRVADLPAGPSRFSDVEDRFAEVVSSKSSGGNPAAGIMAE